MVLLYQQKARVVYGKKWKEIENISKAPRKIRSRRENKPHGQRGISDKFVLSLRERM
jgi:hypothetical protein